jgi:NAD(P)-dependent dehydrogenase (short-subunit alcohol dehydrogenase family)
MHPDSAPIESLDEDYWNRLIAVNLTGVALSMK